jgi:hypothetical protein
MPKRGYIVHHLDEDARNNKPDNLDEILNGHHIALHNIFNRPKRFVKLECTQCQGEIYRELRQYKIGKRPFCSRECFAKSLRTI